MHSKLMLIVHHDYLRIAVPTANLTPTDWGEDGLMENVCHLSFSLLFIEYFSQYRLSSLLICRRSKHHPHQPKPIIHLSMMT